MNRPLMSFVACASLLALGAVAASAADLGPIVEPYLRIHAALADDRIDTLKTDAGEMVIGAEKLGDEGQTIAEAAQKLQESTDLKSARVAFGSLTEAMIKASDGTLPRDVRLGFCSMNQKSWLQRGENIRNPYYGKAMLGCGEFKKVAGH